jgi:hypothetical protein
MGTRELFWQEGGGGRKGEMNEDMTGKWKRSEKNMGEKWEWGKDVKGIEKRKEY